MTRRENQVDEEIELKAERKVQPSRRPRVRDGFNRWSRAMQS